MPDVQLSPVLRHIHRLVGAAPEPTDAELLARFVAARDEAAFSDLVSRHGRMVLGVCRNVLRQQQDAEDAFQATFLVLARKAAVVRWQDSVGNWLYGVAYRVAVKARRADGRRRGRERKAGEMVKAKPDLEWAFRELEAVLAEEVSRLPQKFRSAFVCCCLEGMSKSEAARHLGWKEGTVSGRVAEARKRLQERLGRRGLTLSAALCAGAVGDGAAVSAPLAATTVRAALTAVGGGMAEISARVLELVEGGTKTMVASKTKLMTALILTTGLLAAAGAHLYRGFAAAPPAVATAAPEEAKKADKPPAPKEDGVLSGRVVDPEGKPVEGARVVIQGKSAGQRATTGADGCFRLSTTKPGDGQQRLSLVATAKGYCAAWEDELAPGAEVTLKLVPDLPIKGRVLDLEGRPVAGATVRVMHVKGAPGDDLTPVFKNWQPDGNMVSRKLTKHLFDLGAAGITPTVTTDAAGRFTLTGIGRDRVAVLKVSGPAIEHKTLYVFCRPGIDVKDLSNPEKNRMPGMPRFNLPALYGPTFDHVAGPTKPVEGLVQDKATGKPIAKVSISGNAEGNWWEDYVQAQTDGKGRYRLVGMPVANAYRLNSYAPNEMGYLPGGKKIGGSEGLKPLSQDFELVRGVRVKGRVTDKVTGKPVPAALWYTPLADNKFFKDLPGKEWFTMNSQGHRTEADGSYSLLAVPGSGLIKVRAEVEGNPYVEAVLLPADEKKAYSTKQDGMGQSFITAGGFIDSLFGHNAYKVIDPDPKTETLTCNFEFDPGRTVSGEILDPDGKPLAGVTVAGLSPVWGKNVVLKDATFTAKAVSANAPRPLAFLHKGRKLAGHIDLNGEEKSVKVRLKPWGVVEGRILDEDGKPVSGAVVGVGYPDNATRWLSEEVVGKVPTDNDGKFRIEGILPGLEFAIGFQKGKNFLDAGEGYRHLKTESGKPNQLGDVRTKVYRLP